MKNTLAVIFFVAALMVLVACSPGPAETPPAVRPVKSMVVAAESLDQVSQYAGEVQARYEITLAFRVGGKITERSAEIGQQVQPGDVLMQLDAGDLALNEQALRAQLAAAQADLNQARAKFNRAKALLGRNLISRNDFDTLQGAYETAEARVQQAQSQLSGGARQTGYTQLQTDQAGVITGVQAEVGQIVTAGQPVLNLALPGEKEAVISVPENRYNELRIGETVEIRLWSAPGQIYQGQVREVAPLADPLTRTYAAKVTFVDSDSSVKLGMTASVRARRQLALSAIRLPLTALIEHDGQPAVWVVDPKSLKVIRRKVELGPFHNDQITIARGLAPGERVVTAGVHKLYPDQQIRLLDHAL
ncbi:MAG: efflux RND transporter periplasmic adaptor subunit [Candidatus Competibacteraceae bacterium]|nr:efflux RND transporter periplasmic adaptor subunit [Candidatus Competibacteraceae bacterium]MCP5134596.1 efflux RND transporter periplasmic adaptor subunit [Gammaproteobacteria bacterium]